MTVRHYLRTTDLARAGHISVQQVRNYEASGLLPPAGRGSNGYRLYNDIHLAALGAAQSLIRGYGLGQARAIMGALHQGQLVVALTLIDEYHAELSGRRLQLERTLAALRTLAAQPAATAAQRLNQPLRVGEAARQAGVRVSAVRFWEQQGLLHPARDAGSRYRLYDEQQMRRLRVVALLRGAGYDCDAIRTTLDELTAGRPAPAIAAVEQRRSDLARASWAALTGLSTFYGYVGAYYAELIDRL